MTTLLPSLIRTYVPLLVSFVAAWLLSLGFTVTTQQQTALVSGLAAVIAAAYYTAARVLEARFPWATKLLGSSVQPVVYAPAAGPDTGRHSLPDPPTEPAVAG